MKKNNFSLVNSNIVHCENDGNITIGIRREREKASNKHQDRCTGIEQEYFKRIFLFFLLL